MSVMEYRFYLSKKSAAKVVRALEWMSHGVDALNCGYCTVLNSEHDEFLDHLFKINIPFRKLTLYWKGNPGVQEVSCL